MPRIEINSAWQAMKFYAAYELHGGAEISIPCLMPDPAYTGMVSYRKPNNDERMGEPAVVYLHIKRSLETIINNHLLSASDVRRGLNFARGQIRADAAGTARTMTRKQVEQMNRAVEKLSTVLLPFLKFKGVVE